MKFFAAAFAALLAAAPALAANPFLEAFEACQEMEARSLGAGIEISPVPLEFENGLWMVEWADGSRNAVLSTAPAIHRHEGRLPFVIKHQNELTMIVPYPATIDEDIWCGGELIR